MVMRVGSKEARERFADLVGRVHYGGEVVIIERSGRPMAAMIPLEMYERLQAEREARFQVIERIRERMPEVSPEQVEKDVAEAIAAVRAARDQGRS